MSLYVSTSCLIDEDDIFRVLDSYCSNGISHVELGIGRKTAAPLSRIRLYGFSLLPHHYFPPPRDRFVVNLASQDAALLAQSFAQVKRSIDFCSRFNIPLFSSHGGFCADPDSGFCFSGSARITPHQLAFDTFAASVKEVNSHVHAEVTVTARLYVGSDPLAVRETSYSGKASPAGLFGAAQGMVSFTLDAPGEYWADVLATYTDPEGHLWVASVRHAGVVYPEGSPVVARGKKVVVGSASVDRGETRFEGYVTPDGVQKLAHVAFPYRAGDVLLIAAEGQGANKIEPVLIYQMPGDTSPWDTKLNGVGTTNLRIKTSNGYSPHPPSSPPPWPPRPPAGPPRPPSRRSPSRSASWRTGSRS